jgi:multidrug efflux pump subunit AcrB
MAKEKKWRGFIDYFARHRLAATMLMILTFLCGGWAVFNLNTQFLPNFGLKIITVTVAWPGSSAKEVENSLTVPIEDNLQSLDAVKKLTSVSSQGLSYVIIEFKPKARMATALADVQNAVAQVRNLPQDARKPVISVVPRQDQIARVLVTGPQQREALRYWANHFRQALLRAGIGKVTLEGLPKQTLNIGLSPLQMIQLRKSLHSLGDTFSQASRDIPIGVVGQGGVGKQVKIAEKKRSLIDVANMPIVTGDAQLLVHLVDVAHLSLGYTDYPELIDYHGKPAIQFRLFRDQQENAFDSAKVLHRWLKTVKPLLPEGMKIQVYNEYWHLIRDRLNLLLYNGAGGLVMILILLFVFLNIRVAWWVALGIPISLSAALFVLKLLGGSINMISMFALIMSLGIIVDDTIVVAEQGVSEFYAGRSALAAVVMGAQRMVVPILASSLTTVAAFLPLLLLSGIFGQVLIAIPRLIICVIVASLVESFFILPMHLKHSLAKVDIKKPHPWRKKINEGFFYFRDHYFRGFVKLTLRHYISTLIVVFGSLLLVVGVIAGDHIQFNFFPTPPGRMVNINLTFSSGTSTEKIRSTLALVQQDVRKTAEYFAQQAPNLVTMNVSFTHKSTRRYERRNRNRLGAVVVELSPNERRTVTNKAFIAQLQATLKLPDFVEHVQISRPRGGPPGSDIDIALSGNTPEVLKKASIALQNKLKEYRGVSAVVDNLPYSQSEWVLTMRPQAQRAGFTADRVGRQLRAAFSGRLIHLHYKNNDEVEVRARLNEDDRDSNVSLAKLPVFSLTGEAVPLHSIAKIQSVKGFDSLQHLDRALTVNVQAEVDAAQGNTNAILKDLKKNFLSALAAEYSVQARLRGRSSDQSQTLGEMSTALVLSLGLIYIILAWVSSSYLWPVFVMLAIPLGLEGAVLGHLLLGYNLTLLSLFGFFGLSGIVINDSIILLFRYKELIDAGMPKLEAAIEACCQRFRPVLLTSLTTIAGLAPILFERSMQAQFLIPMAISICFGLLVATVSILIVIPACIRCQTALLEQHQKWKNTRA